MTMLTTAQGQAKEYATTVPIPESVLADNAHVVVLSNRLAIVWSSLVDRHLAACSTLVIFDGVIMGRIQSFRMEAHAEHGLVWSVGLIQTPTYEQPADFVAELTRCGFAVTVNDYRSDKPL